MQVVSQVNGAGPVPCPEGVCAVQLLSTNSSRLAHEIFGLKKVFWITVTMRLLCAYVIPQADTFGPCQRQGNRYLVGPMWLFLHSTPAAHRKAGKGAKVSFLSLKL